jgi:hypothetical protein
LVGTTEKTGNNDGPIVEAILASTGNRKGEPYCASFCYYSYAQAGVAKISGIPRSAWSPDMVNHPTFTAAHGGQTPLPGDIGGIYFPSKGRIAHVFIIQSWGESSAVTIEGNTSPSAEFGSASDRDGDGIWRKRRLKRQIYAVKNWIK